MNIVFFWGGVFLLFSWFLVFFSFFGGGGIFVLCFLLHAVGFFGVGLGTCYFCGVFGVGKRFFLLQIKSAIRRKSMSL